MGVAETVLAAGAVGTAAIGAASTGFAAIGASEAAGFSAGDCSAFAFDCRAAITRMSSTSAVAVRAPG